jgi:putative ABC transport system permease protein
VLEVVGIAANVRQLGLKRDPGPQLYLPQQFSSPQYTIARLAPDAPDLSSAIRAAVLRLDRSIPVPEVSSANTWFEYEIAKPRAYAALLADFAALALLLAAVGVYGVVAYGIARRTHEFGVRMAIGASRRSVFALVATACARLVAVGCVIGVAGGFAVGRALQTLLFEVRPDDRATLAAASAVLITVAMLACFLAARRIGRLEPTIALRYE